MKYIEDWSFGYAMLRPLIRIIYRINFRTISIEGLQNIPQNKPIILAPNHQNALTDALTIVYSYQPQPVFLARADIFKKKLVIAILTFLKIMPVFRIRDGIDSLSQNDKTFDACIRLLKKNKTVSLFPEAAHNGQKSMLPHKKAIPRIAFLAGEKTNFDLDLYIVPVGINYSHYYKFRSDLVIRYGNPIHIKEYYDLLKNENEVVATNALRDRIFSELEKVCVHVPNKDLYEVYVRIFEILDRQTCHRLFKNISPLNLFKTEQYITQKLSPLLSDNSLVKDEIIDAAIEYGKLKNELKLTETSIRKNKMSFGETILNSIAILLLMPFAIPGFILFGWLFYVTNYSFRGIIKDHQFFSSFSYALTLVLLPLWLIVLLIIGLIVLKKWLTVIFSMVLSIPCGIIAWETWQLILKVKNRLRFNHFIMSGNQTLKLMIEKREFLVSSLRNI
jgi:1-acyl-sn-glycerol-3-phosphate acyltransferase